MLEFFLAVFLVFMIKIKGIFIAQLIYFFIFTLREKKIIKYKRLKYYLLYLIYILFDIALQYREEINILRLALIWGFNLTYLIIFVDEKLNLEKFLKYLIYSTGVLAIYNIFIFIGKDFYKDKYILMGLSREWGYEYIPGFPTDVIIPLTFGLFLALYLKKNKLALLITLGTIIIPSRAGQLLITIIWYYFYIRKRKNLLKIIILMWILGICILFYQKPNIFIALKDRYLRAFDRIYI